MLSSWVDILAGATSPEHAVHVVSLRLAALSGDADAATAALQALSRLSPPSALPPAFLASVADELVDAFGVQLFEALPVRLVAHFFSALPPLGLSPEAAEVAAALARDGFTGSCGELSDLSGLLT